MKSVQILTLNEKRIPDVTDVLCDAFRNYPVMDFVLGSSGDFPERLQELIRFFVMARFHRGEPVLGIGDRNRLYGAALISDPGNSTNPPALQDLRERVWARLGEAARSRYGQFSDASAGFSVNVPHIHLNMIGIRAGTQGTGYGRRLMKQVQRISSDSGSSHGVSLTTEDPEKVSFYRHLGYDLLGETPVAPDLRTWSFFRPDPID